MDERDQLRQAITHLEAQWPQLGDALVDVSTAALREKLAALSVSSRLDQAHEDDAERAVRAALAMHRAVAKVRFTGERWQVAGGKWQVGTSSPTTMQPANLQPTTLQLRIGIQVEVSYVPC